MHGYVAAIGHEIWQTWWYPAGHACRCSIGTVNRAEARRRGLTGAEPVGPWPIAPGTGTRALPDPGFRGAPNLETLSLDVEDRARAVLAEAERTGARDLLAALQQLFAVLGIARQLFGLADLLARRSA
jgi:hypothetical protein